MGGDVCGGTDVRRPVRDPRAAPVEGDVLRGAGGRRGRVRDCGDLRGAAR